MVSTNRARKALRLDFFPEPQSTLTVRVVLVLAKHRAGAIHIPSASGTNPDRTRQRMVGAFMPALGADVFLFHLVAEPSAANGRRFVDCVTPGLVELAAALGPRDDDITCTRWIQWFDRGDISNQEVEITGVGIIQRTGAGGGIDIAKNVGVIYVIGTVQKA